MSKFSKKKQVRLDFLEKEYKILINVHDLVDRFAYGKIDAKECMKKICEEVYGVKQKDR